MADITLIHPNSPFLINPATFPPLGIMYLSASLKQMEFSVQCIDMALPKATISDIESDIIGISFTTAQKNEAFSLANRLRSKAKYLIAGGAHATHLPKECLEYFDYVIRGEADFQLPMLLSKLKFQKEKDQILSNFEPSNLDDLPFPDRSALPIKEYLYTIDNDPATTIMTSRSCPYGCSYCAKISEKFRAQSAYRTVSEIHYINEMYGFKSFMIFDDLFTADKRRLEEIVWLLKGKDFKFRCFSRSNLLTKDICRLLKEMNVVEVGIGIESGSDDILKKNMKGTTRKQNLDAMANLHEVGIRVKAFIIIGLPGETTKTLDETKALLQMTLPHDVDFSIFQAMPGSDIYRNTEKYDIIIENKDDSIWYKGSPEEYKGHVRTKELSCEQLERKRHEFEEEFKKKELLK